jgi:hypothetical protein
MDVGWIRTVWVEADEEEATARHKRHHIVEEARGIWEKRA